MPRTLIIKNMVCPRCITVVRQIFEDIGTAPDSVELGKVTLPSELPPPKLQLISDGLKVHGFELLTTGKSVLIEQIKSAIIEQIHYTQEPLKVNFSTYLAERIDQEYSTLSRLFSSVEGVTIEKFITSQKIEKVKELLFYGELTLSEIAHQLNYSSVAHISAQFRKETGMTPTAFRQQKPVHRKSIDKI